MQASILFFFIFLIIQVSGGPNGGRHIVKNSHISRKPRHEENAMDENHDYDELIENVEKNTKNDDHSLGILVKNVEDIYVYSDDKVCAKIDEYVISKKVSFDCFERNLPIYYQANVQSVNKSEKTLAYLSKDKPLITASQKNSKQ